MPKSFIILLSLLLCPVIMHSQDKPAAPTAAPESAAIPADAAHKTNPVKPSAESLAQGKKYYGYDCAMCHGANGDGKGDVAIGENFKIKDFRDPATFQGKTDGDIFYVIEKGAPHMPPERVRSNQNELWNLVNYVRLLASQKN